MNRLSVIGSSGSIGRQVKRIAARYPELFAVSALCVNRNIESLYEDAALFRPRYVGVCDERAAQRLDRTRLFGAEVFVGSEATVRCAQIPEADTAVVAVVGTVGLRSVLAAIGNRKRVALANKESLVTGGNLVVDAAKRYGVVVNPIDSEHGAIWQCLRAGKREDVRRLILTASGGPFRGRTRSELERVTVSETLRHPTWQMGAKITVDSATLMNKGLEIIEARWLFDTTEIDVIVQPTSVVHSMVEYRDGSVLAQMSYPTMEIPIQLALTDPDRYETEIPKLDFAALRSIAFEAVDEKTFGCLALAKRAMRAGGYATTVLNAANEAAVAMFLDGRLPFLGIERTVSDALDRYAFSGEPTLDGIFEIDAEVKANCFGSV